MPNIDPEPPDPSCSRLLPRGGITEHQLLGPDPFFVSHARRTRALRQGELRQPAGPAARHRQTQAARAGSCGPAAERRRRICSTASPICCGRSPRNCYRLAGVSSPPAFGRPTLDETTRNPLSRRKPGPTDQLLVRLTSGPRLPPGQRLFCVPAVLFLPWRRKESSGLGRLPC